MREEKGSDAGYFLAYFISWIGVFLFHWLVVFEYLDTNPLWYILTAFVSFTILMWFFSYLIVKISK